MIRVAFIVNGGFESAMGQRAREMAARLSSQFEIHIAYRSQNKIASTLNFFRFLRRVRPSVSYVFDMAYAGVLGAALYRFLFRNCLIIETGDAIYELARSTGGRSWLGLWLTRWLENFSLRRADRIVVRGSLHARALAEKGIDAEVIQDGVDTVMFAPRDVSEIRRERKLDGLLTIGLVGSSVWSDKLQMCYGWELVEVLRLLKDKPVVGIMIGDGSGIPHLKERCREYGIKERVRFWGYVPFAELPEKLNLIDVCLSTQTNNLVGQVRTTGKLPLYLAAGRYVLASNVGEASLVLGQEMLVEYEGVKDNHYPERLAERINAILEHPEKLRCSLNNVAVAQKYFDYSMLSERLAQVIKNALKRQQ